jgi:hypothetical protein
LSAPESINAGLQQAIAANMKRAFTHYASVSANSSESMWLALAHETVRQMEWVRECCLAEVAGPAEDTYDRIADLELTVAPAIFRVDGG